MTRAMLLILMAACGSKSMSNPGVDGNNPPGDDAPPNPTDGNTPDPDGSSMIDGTITPSARTIIVIPMENKSDAQIYGDSTDAPYINGLFATAAHATNLNDELPSLDSEPHYIWMEAGTNVFSDTTFASDSDVSASNSTASTEHLVTKLAAAGKTWTAYQMGMTSGTCPIASTGEYAAKHGPFVFFRDISGSPPKSTTAGCISHYKPITSLATDTAAGTLANYVFVTPDLCNDMHGDLLCASGLGTASNIQAGDNWLKTNLPPLIAYTHTHDAVIFIVWDEGDSTNKVPFLAIGDHVKPGVDPTTYTHSSMVKTVMELLGVPPLATVTGATDFAAMFTPGYL